MKNLVKLFSFLFFVLFLQSLTLQNKEQEINLGINNLQLNASITFDIVIENCSKQDLVIYRPDVSGVNSNLLSVQLVDEENNQYNVFRSPVIDLESIKLTCSNSIILSKGDSFIRQFQFYLEEFVPNVNKGKYSLKVWLNYEEVNFVNNQKDTDVFQQDIFALSKETIIID